LPYS